MKYLGGWKSIFYSFHIAKEVGLGEFTKSIRSKNTCKTCAYGMGGQKGGMVNEADDHLEICKKSMQAQLTDIQPGISADFWSKNSITDLKKLKARDLERLGRLADPLYKPSGAEHYKVISWEQVFQKIAHHFNATSPNKTFFYSSGRSSNEAAFLLHFFARVYGTNNVNNCSYYCHQASGVGMSKTLGTGTATIELSDLKQADLVFVIGANPASNHPRFLTELLHCRRRGGEVIAINPAKEPGLVNFVIPSDWRSMLSTGSEIASMYLQPTIGGDQALLYGIAKYLIEHKLTDRPFLANFTENASDFEDFIRAISWEELTEKSGIPYSMMEQVALKYAKAKNVVFSWAMGITHHTHGVQNVEAIVSLALLRGMIGRRHAGLLPLRGHSNVQGVGTVGVKPDLSQDFFDKLKSKYGLNLPSEKGWDTMKCMQEAAKGNVDFAFILGGNLYASNPNLNFAEKALDQIPLKVFVNTTLNQGHLYGVAQEVLLLPTFARDEEPQKTTQESMFNFVRLSDGGDLRLKNAKSEVEIICEIATRVIDKQTWDFEKYRNYDQIREAIASLIPSMDQIEKIGQTKEEFQIPGRTYHEPKFNTESKKARFALNPLPELEIKKEHFRLMSVRSEGQFNSIIYDEDDAWRGTKHRNVILMNKEDMRKNELKTGQKVNITSRFGQMKGIEVQPFEIKEGCVMGYYPETNVLVSSELDPRSFTPSFKNTEVWIDK